MDDILYIGLIVVAIIVIVGIPVGISFLIDWFIKKKNYDKRFRLIALIPIILFGYFIYVAIFPTEEFYKEDFKEVTGVDFPQNGEIIYKTATYPDQFGDHTSTSIVKVDRKFYEKLEVQLIAKGLVNNAFKKEEEIKGPLDLAEVEKEIVGKKIKKGFSMTTGRGVFYYVGFVSDNETIIIQRHSW